MYHLSPSSLHVLESCPRCFWLQIVKRVRRPEGIYPSLPTGIDRILKEYFDSARDAHTLPLVLKEKGISAENVQLYQDAALLDVWRDAKRGLQFQTDGILLRGAVDNLLQSKESGKIIVLDYKTRGYPLKEDTAHHYQDQLNIYNFLLRKMGYPTEDYAYLLFYHPDKVNEDGEFLFHSDLVKMDVNVDHASQLVQLAVRTLNAPIPESSSLCEYCNWKKNVEHTDVSNSYATPPKPRGRKGAAKQLTLL